MTTTSKIIRFDRPGGPEVLVFETAEVGDPAPGEALIRQTAIGVNFLDIYHRSGAYDMAMPSGLGSEAVGVVESVGEGVSDIAPGDRVGYAGGAPGSYAQWRIVPADRLVRLPDEISDEQAAAVLLKGMTVEYLLNRCFSLKAGMHGLFYAAAGGVGLIAGQWARHLGAKLIGVAGGADKCRLALDNGYHEVIDRTREDVAARVKQITEGRGVPVVYDSVGKATFDASLDALAPRGYFVSFGTTTGAPPPVAAATLQKRGSLYFTRPTLVTYTAAREDLVASAQAVFDMVRGGHIKVSVNQRFPLERASDAHAALEGGKTTGSTLLIP